jgi:hypothetical protein
MYIADIWIKMIYNQVQYVVKFANFATPYYCYFKMIY